ncbi:hypothetical protein RJ640_023669 [Escallonia rubra]|uniref:F-box domain-containing protein n=1 Tax=Escallonia rubra TaxID=112253 RepID=A0AA88U6H9_9ASTE|nr:hypothetical protein RJ640_023669 [Escallonia rubra]
MKPNIRRRPSPQRCRTNDGDDRLSNLPDEILCHILSFLPTKNVVATSILSSRYSSLWSCIPVLDFHYQPHLHSPQKFVEFVNKLVDKHQTKKNQGLKWVVVVLVVTFGEGSDDGVPRPAIGWVHLVEDVAGVAKIAVVESEEAEELGGGEGVAYAVSFDEFSMDLGQTLSQEAFDYSLTLSTTLAESEQHASSSSKN